MDCCATEVEFPFLNQSIRMACCSRERWSKFSKGSVVSNFLLLKEGVFVLQVKQETGQFKTLDRADEQQQPQGYSSFHPAKVLSVSPASLPI